MQSLDTRQGGQGGPSTPGVVAEVQRSGMPARPLYVQIAERIRQEIASGLLKPGAELPTIPELMAAWECSAEPVRRALRELDTAGVIVTRQGRRAIVAQPAS